MRNSSAQARRSRPSDDGAQTGRGQGAPRRFEQGLLADVHGRGAGSEFLYALQLTSGETVLAHVPSHDDHRVGEWIGIQPEVDHLVVFAPEAPA